MEPYNLASMQAAFSKCTHDIVYYLPRTTDIRQLSQLCKSLDRTAQTPVRHYCIKGASKVELTIRSSDHADPPGFMRVSRLFSLSAQGRRHVHVVDWMSAEYVL